MPGYQDPKSQGDAWGHEEILSRGQMNIIADNQRHFATQMWLGLVETQDFEQTNVTAINQFIRDPTGNNPESVWLCNGTSDVADVGLYAGLAPEMDDTAHGLTTTSVNSVTAITSRPMDAAWFGLDKEGGATVGYFRLDADGTWTRASRAAGASSDAALVRSINYGDTGDGEGNIVASWSDGDIEVNSTGLTSWSRYALGSALYDLHYGNGVWVGAEFGTTSVVHTSTAPATLWTTTALPASASQPMVAYDDGAGVWYVLDSNATGSSLNLYTSSSPTSSFSTVPNTVNPAEGGSSFSAFAAHGGILALFSSGTMYLTTDLGQTWMVYNLGSGVRSYGAKFVGGRLVILGATSPDKIWYTTPSFTPFLRLP